MSESDASPMPEDEGAGEFQRIFNPYVIGNPIRGGEPFFGREDDFATAARRLQSERSGIVLLFAGARRSGKTSIMFQILDGRLGPEFLTVFIDMQQLAGIDGDGQMLGRMARSVIEGVGDERLVADYYEFDEGNPILTFDRLLADINQIFPDKRLLLLVDEAELLRDKVHRGEVSSAILTFMASALESRRVSFFFTGSPGLAETDVPEWKRLMGKGLYSEISFLTPGDTSRLATEPLDDRVRYADGVLTAIYQLTYGHPFYTQLICTNAVDHLNSNCRYDLSAEDLDEVVRTIVNNPPPQLVYDWEQFSHEEQLVLSLLSEVSEAPHVPVAPEALQAAIEHNEYPIDINASDLHVILETLDGRMVLSRSEDGGYHFLVDLVRLWVRRNRSVWRLMEEQEVAPSNRPKWLIGGAAAALLLVVGAIVGLRGDDPPPPARASAASSTGAVWIEAFAAGTQVRLQGPLDGEQAAQVHERAETRTMIDGLTPGLYAVELTHPLYHALVDTLRIAAGMRDTIRGTPLRRTGSLSVRPLPARAMARITHAGEGIDSAAVGRLEDLQLPTGSYSIEVTLDGFRPWHDEVDVGSQEKVIVEPALVADVGALLVTSTPTGAALSVDSQPVGPTPQLLEALPVGRRAIRLEAQHHQPVQTTWNVQFGRRDTLSVPMVLLPATLTLRSTPPGARVQIDGTVLADTITPVRLVRAPGSYRINLEVEGYDAHDTTVALVPDGAHHVTPALKQQFGDVHITRPLFGTLIVNGVRGTERSLGTRSLPVGTYVLELEKYEGKRVVEVRKDETTTVMWE